jgi:hypothetical protein
VLDLTAEQPIPLADACKLIPPARQGKRTHLSTVLRWILDGVKSPAGETVRLEGIRLGGRWMTSREAIQRFAERLTPVTDTPSPTAPRTPTRRQKAAEQAGRELTAIGI